MPLILLVYVLVNLAVLLLSSDLSSALMQVAVDFVLMSGFIWPLLFVSAKLNRYRQTLVALLGTDALINFFALPISESDLAITSFMCSWVIFVLQSGQISSLDT